MLLSHLIGDCSGIGAIKAAGKVQQAMFTLL
jgi:hypothetical protein